MTFCHSLFSDHYLLFCFLDVVFKCKKLKKKTNLTECLETEKKQSKFHDDCCTFLSFRCLLDISPHYYSQSSSLNNRNKQYVLNLHSERKLKHRKKGFQVLLLFYSKCYCGNGGRKRVNKHYLLSVEANSLHLYLFYHHYRLLALSTLLGIQRLLQDK